MERDLTPAELWESLAEVIAASADGTLERLQAAHLPDARGCCRGCVEAVSGVSLTYPCPTRLLADRAELIRRRRPA